MAEHPFSPARAASDTTPRVGRVLIVDDEPQICRSLRLLLSDEFEVTSITDPREALRWLTTGDWYDAVLCDVVMPRMNGVELHDAVRSARADLAARIVFVTGGILMPSVRRLLDGVSNTVLSKPFDFVALRDVIRRRVDDDAPEGSALGPVTRTLA